MNAIVERSFILEKLIEDGALGIVGGMHNLEVGRVECDDHAQAFFVAELGRFGCA